MVNVTLGDAVIWRRASFCGSGECVEVALDEDAIRVRDSKDQSGRGPILSYTRAEWTAFVQGVKAGEFDL